MLAQAVTQIVRLSSSLSEIVVEPSFWLRVVISGIVGTTLYLFFGWIIASRFPRSVSRDVFTLSLTSDLGLALISLAFGTLVISAFGVAHEKWGVMLVYNNISEHGWAWYVASIPIYLLIWDFVFYVLHLALHMEPIYSVSHANHHAFRPPTAWAGIAIDPIESVFSGLAPYLVPLFLLPFHLPTVYAINILLVAWAQLLHSSAPWRGTWLLVGTTSHNLHHARGIRNGNYAAIFKIYDRLFGTLQPADKLAFWQREEELARARAAAAPTAAESAPASARRRVSARKASPAARARAVKASPARSAYLGVVG